MFGLPEFTVAIEKGKIVATTVIRGAPCGSTWKAASVLTGLPAASAGERMGLEIQYVCSANPASWNVLGGKSPLHFAGQVHQKALERALKKVL